MVPDIFRDATFGQFLNKVSNGRIFPFEDQKPGYVIPKKYLIQPPSTPVTTATVDDPSAQTTTTDPSLGPQLSQQSSQSGSTLVDRTRTPSPSSENPIPPPIKTPQRKQRESFNEHNRKAWKTEKQRQKALSQSTSVDEQRGGKPRAKDDEESEEKEPPTYQYLVDWEEDDPDKPINWSRRKRLFVGSMIMLLTFSGEFLNSGLGDENLTLFKFVVYVGSAIYTSSIPGIIQQFGVAQVVGTLGLSLFVLAYGIGPMFLAPIQEMPHIGRTPVYVWGLFLFAIFQFPVIYAPNIGCILVFRFFAGFVGSPALATGGASMGEIFSPKVAPAAIGGWALGAVMGPVLGPGG